MKRTVRGIVLQGIVALAVANTYGGDLQPPGPPGPTMKTLVAVEPRIPISAEQLPLTITTPGSYYLTGNILTGGAGIQIQAEPVTIDLNGFTLYGGTGHGIWTEAPYSRTTVRNGRVMGWTGAGIRLGALSRVEDVETSNNGAEGVLVDDGSFVRSSYAGGNTTNGIEVRAGCLVLNCIANANGHDGIHAETGSIVRDSVAYHNHDNGIYGTNSVSIAGCSATANGKNGIRVDDYSFVLNNLANQNGTIENDKAGVFVFSEINRIDSNLCIDNSDWGVRINGQYNQVIRNTTWGTILDDGNYNDVAPTQGYDTSTNPWAND